MIDEYERGYSKKKQKILLRKIPTVVIIYRGHWVHSPPSLKIFPAGSLIQGSLSLTFTGKFVSHFQCLYETP